MRPVLISLLLVTGLGAEDDPSQGSAILDFATKHYRLAWQDEDGDWSHRKGMWEQSLVATLRATVIPVEGEGWNSGFTFDLATGIASDRDLRSRRFAWRMGTEIAAYPVEGLEFGANAGLGLGLVRIATADDARWLGQVHASAGISVLVGPINGPRMGATIGWDWMRTRDDFTGNGEYGPQTDLASYGFIAGLLIAHRW